MNSLAGKTAVITGAGRGIGAATAEALAARGAHVVLAARSIGGIAALAAKLPGALAVTTGTGNSETISAVIAGTAGLAKANDTGTLTLSARNTYTGITVINGGTLTIGGAGQLNSGSYAANIYNYGAFTYGSSAPQTLTGVISGTGTMTINSGTVVLGGGNINTYSGVTTINGGTLQLGQSGASLAPEDRIKVNSAIVVIEENMPIFHAVLSNGYSFLERNDFRSFRAAFDDRQQSNLVSVLKTDRRCLEQVVKYCQEREKLSRQAGMR